VANKYPGYPGTHSKLEPPRVKTKDEQIAELRVQLAAQQVELAHNDEQMISVGRRQKQSNPPPSSAPGKVVAEETFKAQVSIPKWFMVMLFAVLFGGGGYYVSDKVRDAQATPDAPQIAGYAEQVKEIRAERSRDIRENKKRLDRCESNLGYVLDILDEVGNIDAERPEGIAKPGKLEVTAPNSKRGPLVVGGRVKVALPINE